MRYVLVAAILASIAGIEYLYTLASAEAPGAAVCLAPEGKAAEIRDAVLNHLQSH